ncbi:MAG TPA: ATP-grasp domain-containing protein [Gemmatimonadales bacterium]|nr:ATP-grasp domain-containing protein [Gemmatimonadales bacterium]
MRIGILFDGGSQDWDQKDVAAIMSNVTEIQTSLRRAGHDTTLLPVHLGDVGWLRRAQRHDLIFNLCEGVNGYARYEDFAVAALELTRVPFTGCPSWPVTICHRKHIANTLLAAAGVPVPPFVLARGITPPSGLRYPVIVKPSGEDASVGIDSGSVCATRKALRDRLAKVGEQWDEILIQEYVPGREVNVGFVGRDILPLSEILFDRMPAGSWPIVTYAAKWDTGSAEDLGTEPVCPAKLTPELSRRVIQAARQAWDTLTGSKGYGRVDLRITEQGEVYVLEVNPNPDLSTDAGLARMAGARGWEYGELLLRVVEEAVQRSEQARAAEALTQNIPAA